MSVKRANGGRGGAGTRNVALEGEITPGPPKGGTTNGGTANENVLVIRNRQRSRVVDTRLLRRLTVDALRNHLHVDAYELCLHLVDAEEMAQVNEQFLQHTGSTDVITFDLSDSQHGASGPVQGEIFISIPDAIAQAKEFKTTWQAELARYVIHGLLHLRGYDDLEPAARRTMKREENRLMKRVETNYPLRSLGRDASRRSVRS